MAGCGRFSSGRSCGRKTRNTGRRHSCFPRATRCEGFDALDHLGWVKELGDDQRYAAIAADYLQALNEKKSVLVVSPTHKEAAVITAAIRSKLREAGKLGGDEREFIRLVQVRYLRGRSGQPEMYQPGDVLQFHQNAKGFTKGERFTVTDPAEVPLAEAGEILRLPAGEDFAGGGRRSSASPAR